MKTKKLRIWLLLSMGLLNFITYSAYASCPAPDKIEISCRTTDSAEVLKKAILKHFKENTQEYEAINNSFNYSFRKEIELINQLRNNWQCTTEKKCINGYKDNLNNLLTEHNVTFPYAKEIVGDIFNPYGNTSTKEAITIAFNSGVDDNHFDNVFNIYSDRSLYAFCKLKAPAERMVGFAYLLALHPKVQKFNEARVFTPGDLMQSILVDYCVYDGTPGADPFTFINLTSRDYIHKREEMPNFIPTITSNGKYISISEENLFGAQKKINL